MYTYYITKYYVGYYYILHYNYIDGYWTHSEAESMNLK